MRIHDPDTLERFRNMPCEVCGHSRPNDPHHVRTKGAGQIDAPWNLVALCRLHHSSHHYGGQPTTETCLSIICKRMGVTYDQINEELYRIRNLDKAADPNKDRPAIFAAYPDRPATLPSAKVKRRKSRLVTAKVPGRAKRQKP